MSINQNFTALEIADLSKGISHTNYENLCQTLVELGGSILDAGAGVGNLLSKLLAKVPTSRLVGMDIFEKPQHLPSDLGWYRRDFNNDWDIDHQFDVVVSCHILIHLENPWHVFRQFAKVVHSGGYLVLVLPNHLSLNSMFPLLLGKHFHQRKSAPEMFITQLLPLDLQQLCEKNGFKILNTYYNDTGVILHRWGISWQTISFGLLKGRWFKDEVTLIAQKVA